MFINCTIELVKIVDYVTGSGSQADRDGLRDHLDTGCESCSERLTLMQGLHSSAETREPQMITGDPLLDIQELHFAGVRSVASLARRRVYESESKVCIDIQQQESEDGSLTLEGQVLIRGGDLDEVTGAKVTLLQSGRVIMESEADVVGDFSLINVLPGTYDLTITATTVGVSIRDIEL